MKAKEIILLILIIVVGILFTQLYTGEIDVHFDFDDDFIIFSNEFDYEDYQEFEPPFPSLIQVVNYHGDIDILGTDEEKMTITLQKKVWRRNEEKAQKIADELKMIIDKETDRWIISTNRYEFDKKNFRNSFRISVPSDMDIEVTNSYGTVDVANVKNADITNRHGETIVSDIAGELFLKNSYRDVDVKNIDSDIYLESNNSSVFVSRVKGKAHIVHRYGKIYADNISKDVKVEGSHSDVNGENLTGPLEIESSYRKIFLMDVGPTKIIGHSCEIEVERAEEYLDIKDSYGKVKVTDLKGNLVIDGKNLEISGRTIVGEKIDIKSSYRNIELSEFSGKTTIVLSHGEVALEPYPLTYPLEVKGDYSTIKLSWPLGKKYPFEAKVKNGDIEWKLPEEVSIQEEDHTRTIKAFIEAIESPSIFLYTSYRTIWVTE
jgi:hypothetical protein